MDTTQTIDVTEWQERIEQYYVDYAPLVERAARHVTGNDYDAEDVVQTVFIRLLQRDVFQGIEKNPAGYLHCAAVREAISLLRWRKRKKTSGIPKVKDAGPEFTDNRTRPDLQNDAAARLDAALAQLEPEVVEMLLLHLRDGYSAADIAKEFGMKRGTVASLLSRNRARLQEIL